MVLKGSMPKFRKQYYKALESSRAAAAKNVFKFTKKASDRKAQDDDKHEKELHHPHWLHDLAFFEWLLDQPTDSGFDAVWDKFKRDWDGFTGDNFPATTHRQGPMVNQFKAVRRGKKRMYMKTTVKEGRARLAEKSVLPPHVKVIDYLRSMKGLAPRTEVSRVSSPAPTESVIEVVPEPRLASSSEPGPGSPADETTAPPSTSDREIPRTKKKRSQMAAPSFIPNPYQSRGNIFAELG